MPIELQHVVQQIPEKEFYELDYEIMRMAFDAHNDLGRFYDEIIYKNELDRRCGKAGIPSTKEFEAKLIHKDFEKSLFLDLLVNGSSVYELKAAKAIVEPNRAQALNYLFSTNTQNGKLINFRPPSVEHEFVSTNLTHEKRKRFSIDDRDLERGGNAYYIREILVDLLNDWGAFFDTDIYLDALCHFLGGKESIIRSVAIHSGNILLGQQPVPHLSDTEGFCITSLTKNILLYKKHLIRFLKHTRFESMHWINFNHSKIHFSSLKRKSFCP